MLVTASNIHSAPYLTAYDLGGLRPATDDNPGRIIEYLKWILDPTIDEPYMVITYRNILRPPTNRPYLTIEYRAWQLGPIIDDPYLAENDATSLVNSLNSQELRYIELTPESARVKTLAVLKEHFDTATPHPAVQLYAMYSALYQGIPVNLDEGESSYYLPLCIRDALMNFW
jgi:hypothetical protein